MIIINYNTHIHLYTYIHIHIYMNDKIPNISNKEQIFEFITNYINPDKNKKQNGEIFTPIDIIDNMLNKLNEAYYEENKENIFSNPNLLWYDSSCGIGNFMIFIYYKLYDGLKNIIKNSKKRKQHIIENMLFMSEINENNVNICKKIFNPENKYNLNINLGNSLDFDVYNKWKINNFDIIIGNPPYQKGNKKTNSSRGGTNNNLYLDFIDNSFELLKPNGYLVYIHPPNWRKIGSKIFTKMIEKQFIIIDLNYNNIFKNISVKTDIYVIKNSNLIKPTTINCFDKKSKLIMTSNVILDKNPEFIPNIFSNEIKNIFNKMDKYGISYKCTINSDCHKIRDHVQNYNDKIYKYPLYNTSGNPFEYFSSRPHKDQYKNKVIMSCSGKLKPFYDNGVYGTTQDSMYYICDDEQKNNGKFIVDVLDCKLYKFIINICRWGNFRNEANLMSYIKFPKCKNYKQKINDEYIYQFFKLSQMEIDLVEKYYK